MASEVHSGEECGQSTLVDIWVQSAEGKDALRNAANALWGGGVWWKGKKSGRGKNESEYILG